MRKGVEEKRREYMSNIRMMYGVDIKEYKQIGQRCGYFHMTFPIFILDQEPGSEPIGFQEPITEYTEARMKYIVNNKLFGDEWYLKMCTEWKNKELIVTDIENPIVYEVDAKWVEAE